MPSNTASARFDQWFHLTERGSTTSREVRGGIVTFFTMAYILALNPLIIGTAADKNGKLLNGAPKFLDAAGTSLNTAGIDDNKIMVMAVTAFVAAIMTIAMGVWGRFPMGIATGLGINSLLAYVVAPTMTWSQAMGLVVWEGIFILVFVLTGVREMIFRAVPNSLRSAISVGIGLFIAFVGFVDSGVIRPGSGTPVTLGVGGSLEGWPILLCLFGFLLLVVLHQRHIKGSMLIAIIGTSLVGVAIEAVGNIGAQSDKNPTGWALNVPRLPGASDFRWPDLGLLGHVDLFGGFLANGHFRIGVFLGTLLVVFSLMLADFFDTMGTVVAIGDHAGFLTRPAILSTSRESWSLTPWPRWLAVLARRRRQRVTSSRLLAWEREPAQVSPPSSPVWDSCWRCSCRQSFRSSRPKQPHRCLFSSGSS